MQNRKRDTDVQGRLLDSVGEGEGGMFWENSIETSILSRVKQTTSPGWMHETSAQGWCTGKTQRDGMGREEGGRIGMGSTCKSMADLCQCSLQIVKINEKINKKQRHYFVHKGPSSQGYGFSSGHVWIWELDYKEIWVPKNSCFWTVLLEKTFFFIYFY